MDIIDILKDDALLRGHKIDILTKAIEIIIHNGKVSNELLEAIDKGVDCIGTALKEEMMRNINQN